MTFNQMRAAAEAILFAAGEPVETAKIAQALDIEIEDAETVLRSCAEQLDERESGVCLLKLGERYQLCTRQEYAENIRSVLDMKRNVPLSSAAFEVLAVVAYNQPVTKAYVEQVRGVDCSGVISELPEREEKEQETEKEEAKTFEVPAEEPAQPAQAEPEDGEDFDFDEFDVDAGELENMYE